MKKTNSYIGKADPIVIEFTYEDWRRLSRLSNKRGGEWLLKFYDAIFKKAGLLTISDNIRIEYKVEIQEIVCGYRAYAKYEKILRKKYSDRDRPWIDFQHGPSSVLQPSDPEITPDQILIRPEAFGSHTWRSNVFR